MARGDAKLPDEIESLPTPEELQVAERVVEGIEDFLSDALALLSDQDRDLLVAHYGLEDVAPRTPSYAELRTEDARDVALQRARRRFNKTLESLLRGAIRHERGDREALRKALAFVRGEAA